MKNRFNVSAQERQDVYTRVTDHIAAKLEKGVRPWVRPWSVDNTEGRIIRPLRFNGLPYAGINVLMLWCAAMEKGYDNPIWMTFRQAKELNGFVRQGEKGNLVVYGSTFEKMEASESGEPTLKNIPFLKGYNVFNVAQIEGLPEHYYAKPERKLNDVQRIEHTEAFLANTKAVIRHGGNRAYYSERDDYIQLPPIEAFEDPASYYATAFHEASHWTKHPSRLNRDMGGKKFGDNGYAFEEIIVELAASYLCADLELAPNVREENSAYISHWIERMKEDKKFIFQAASYAQKAADYLHNLQNLSPTLESEPSPNNLS